MKEKGENAAQTPKKPRDGKESEMTLKGKEKEVAAPSKSEMSVVASSSNTEGSAAASGNADAEVSLFDKPKVSGKGGLTLSNDTANPDDIDINNPEVEDLDDGDDQELADQNMTTESSEAVVPKDSTATCETESAAPAPASAETAMSGALPPSEAPSISEVAIPTPASTEAESSPPTLTVSNTNGKSDDSSEAMHDYLRSTRGLPLRTLALYLMPIRASVISRAIDLSVLKRITLLHVGIQTPLWGLLAKENRTSPLPLRKIYTDNVSPVFLGFVNELSSLTELFMLERSTKSKVESLAGKTTVGIEDIRKKVLKKHMKTIKKLLIKNENDYSWDANANVVELLTKRGGQLQELAISFGLRPFVSFFLPASSKFH
jgi:hypothetical protein